ncbi:hypothetical protein PR001_g4550 [Phytophthora rubi]|uniref:ARS-binding protein 1 N-terminal domain-containing protein n=1 Tax=Phytophthora rubi TaxID=129364 RepID=A0A6A3NT55_9STRA|nr:hypothetical protein PR002_g4712 [Phytophthora rubi]KAE9046442.1 hypothetical protein PR001_g4550 [Phytophthora rubi]
MGRQPSSYVSLSLEQKNLLCEKHKAEPSLTHAQLARWATQQLQTQGDVKRSTVQGILKRSADFVDLPDSQRQRKRRCLVALCVSDQNVMQKLVETRRGTTTPPARAPWCRRSRCAKVLSYPAVADRAAGGSTAFSSGQGCGSPCGTAKEGH